jgi:hypothetical protein
MGQGLRCCEEVVGDKIEVPRTVAVYVLLKFCAKDYHHHCLAAEMREVQQQKTDHVLDRGVPRKRNLVLLVFDSMIEVED